MTVPEIGSTKPNGRNASRPTGPAGSTIARASSRSSASRAAGVPDGSRPDASRSMVSISLGGSSRRVLYAAAQLRTAGPTWKRKNERALTNRDTWFTNGDPTATRLELRRAARPSGSLSSSSLSERINADGGSPRAAKSLRSVGEAEPVSASPGVAGVDSRRSPETTRIGAPVVLSFDNSPVACTCATG